MLNHSCVSVDSKLQALGEVDKQLKSKADIAKEYSVPASTLSTWIKSQSVNISQTKWENHNYAILALKSAAQQLITKLLSNVRHMLTWLLCVHRWLHIWRAKLIHTSHMLITSNVLLQIYNSILKTITHSFRVMWWNTLNKTYPCS